MRRHLVGLVLASALSVGCGRSAIVSSKLPVKRVVVYRNGVAYFERAGTVDDEEVRFKMRETEVGDFLATLAVMERGGSSVRSAAFPIKIDEDEEDEPKPRAKMTPEEKRGLKDVVLHLDGEEHDLRIGYVAESPVWRPSYRLVVGTTGTAELQAWGIVENISGEDWRNVELTLVAGAPLAFESQLGTPTIPPRPTVTDEGEVIAAVPRSETTLRQSDKAEERARSKKDSAAPSSDAAPAAEVAAMEAREESDGDDESGADAKGGLANKHKAATRGRPMAKPAPQPSQAPSGGSAPYRATTPMAPPPPPMALPSGPRDVRALAGVAQEGGTTRYVLPRPVTVPDKSATMVMLLAQSVPGEASFLFAPDYGVPDSSSHPFRVARFKNATRGVLEKGPIAVFDHGAFLGQGVLDPLPVGATTTVPFALERGLAVDREQSHEELGERLAKIENGMLYIERDSVTRTTYRLRNGLDAAARVLVKHARIAGSRLHQPPKGTEDNTGTMTALVPGVVAPHGSADVLVDERTAARRYEDWFSPLAESALAAYRKDAHADRAVVAKLDAVWAVRGEIVSTRDARQKIAVEEQNLRGQSEETRRNLRAIEKNKAADLLRQKLTQRLAEMSARLDELTKRSVELDTKLTELQIRFRDGIRDIKMEAPPLRP